MTMAKFIPNKIDLETGAKIRSFLSGIIRASLQKKIEPPLLSAINGSLNVALKTLEVDDLETKLQELEKKLEKLQKKGR